MSGIDLRGVTEGWATDRFLKIQSGSLIRMPQNGVFRYFYGVFGENISCGAFGAAKMSEIYHFLPKSGPLFEIFGAFGAENWIIYRF